MFIRIFTFAFGALFLFISTSAQTATNTQTTTTKIAIINSAAFGDEKIGITKFVSAVNTVNAPFMSVNTELTTMSTRLQTLGKEIDAAREQLSKGVAVDEKSIQAKVDEAEKLERDIKFKQEDAKARYQKQYQAIVGPVMQAIGTGLQEYAKQKGFSLIFDASKDDRGFLIAIGDDKVDVTKDFIAYYNARPAAPTTKP